ncbi:CcdC protein domain-containing protein [Paenibacillus planticolens]|uniref:DUF1453 family protein n=1 Tax=Paenibacillus planticolens TaxID=2654976 RepID=A0ABX1ZWT6_9BACL|nr:CcdC protein domain-containing protein [Paenibacillus planticolens]NOV04328.1 DUF1453 family protein [Paenibacillus planticolens]
MNTYLIVLVILILLMVREREVRPSRMWITPALFVWLIFSNVLQKTAMTPLNLLLYVICLFVGIGIGLWRGKLDKVRIHPQSGKVTSQSSWASIVLFMGIVLLRMLAESWGKAHLLVSLSSALLFISLGSVCARRYFLFLRYKQLRGSTR